MINLDLGKVNLDVDTILTRRFYQTEPEREPDCFYCENYMEAVKVAMNDPASPLAVLMELGINPSRIAQSSYMHIVEPGVAIYDCTAFVIGKILRYEMDESGRYAALHYKGIPLCVRIDRKTFYNTERDVPDDAIQLDYVIPVPWVLPQSPEGH